jgi:hypothetical protein
LAETSQPSISEYSQPPSIASSCILFGVELEAYESYTAKKISEESSIQALKTFFEECWYPTNKQVNKLSSCSAGLRLDELEKKLKMRGL